MNPYRFVKEVVALLIPNQNWTSVPVGGGVTHMFAVAKYNPAWFAVSFPLEDELTLVPEHVAVAQYVVISVTVAADIGWEVGLDTGAVQ
jgi:hypothetical protein